MWHTRPVYITCQMAEWLLYGIYNYIFFTSTDVYKHGIYKMVQSVSLERVTIAVYVLPIHSLAYNYRPVHNFPTASACAS